MTMDPPSFHNDLLEAENEDEKYGSNDNLLWEQSSCNIGKEQELLEDEYGVYESKSQMSYERKNSRKNKKEPENDLSEMDEYGLIEDLCHERRRSESKNEQLFETQQRTQWILKIALVMVIALLLSIIIMVVRDAIQTSKFYESQQHQQRGNLYNRFHYISDTAIFQEPFKYLNNNCCCCNPFHI